MTVIYYMKGVIHADEEMRADWRSKRRTKKMGGLAVAKDADKFPASFHPEDLEPELKPENQAKKRKHRSPKEAEKAKGKPA